MTNHPNSKTSDHWYKGVAWEKSVEHNRKKFTTSEGYYNNKYPKLNVTFPNILQEKKHFTSSKPITLYNVDVRTILNSKSFRLPKIIVKNPQKKGSRLSSIISYIEQKTRYDLNFDGEIGVEADPVKKHNKIAFEALRWVVKNITYTQLNDTGKATGTGYWSFHRKINKLNPDVTEIEKIILDGENWSFSYQTLERKNGDCEDGAILLYDILRNSGIPAWKLRLNAGIMATGEGHCWLSYYVESQFWQSKRDDKWVILDWCSLPDTETKVEDRIRHKENKHYKLIDFSFNEDYAWSVGKLIFAPFYHLENCAIFDHDMDNRYFDWDFEVCTCGGTVVNVSN